MFKAILEKLAADADLVANVGVRLGRLKTADLLTALGAANKALDSDTASPEIVAQLQTALNGAVNEISPITLHDLRSGWTPFDHEKQGVGTWFFGLFSLLLIASAAYTTQIYDRARSLYDTTMELQSARGTEQATRLFGLLKRNQQDVIDSLTSGKKEFLYEAFSKALYDLELMNLKFQAYVPHASDVLNDLDIVGKLRHVLTNGSSANPTNNEQISDIIAKAGKNYGSAKPESANPTGIIAVSTPAVDLTKLDVSSLLDMYITDQRQFNSTINVGFDPLSPTDYSYNIVHLRDGMRFLGSWLLPALYGMLGAVIFHMRRLLDPNLPNPSLFRFSYRIALGGFAGIILVWFWTPSTPTHTLGEFAPLTSFGLAFLVGFSTDVFFQALDRLVSYLSQTIAK
jgi:hypothetical protein